MTTETLDTSTKLCTRCNTNRSRDLFGNRRTSKDGKNSACKDCIKGYQEFYAATQPDKPILKECKKCGEMKDTEKDFYKHKRNKYGVASSCKECGDKVQNIYRLSEQGKAKILAMRKTGGRYAGARGKAKQKGQNWDICRNDYYKLVLEPCHYCLKIRDEYGIGLDRIDNDLGYRLSNVLTCCGICNSTRGDRFTVAQMELLGKVIANF